MPDFPDDLLPVLQSAWSAETSPQWLPGNPAKGQCNVIALVVHDFFGGETLKTETSSGWHYYNRVAGAHVDLTASQFASPIHYADVASDRTEALAGTSPDRYGRLRAQVGVGLKARQRP